MAQTRGPRAPSPSELGCGQWVPVGLADSSRSRLAASLRGLRAWGGGFLSVEVPKRVLSRGWPWTQPNPGFSAGGTLLSAKQSPREGTRANLEGSWTTRKDVPATCWNRPPPAPAPPRGIHPRACSLQSRSTEHQLLGLRNLTAQSLPDATPLAPGHFEDPDSPSPVARAGEAQGRAPRPAASEAHTPVPGSWPCCLGSSTPAVVSLERHRAYV